MPLDPTNDFAKRLVTAFAEVRARELFQVHSARTTREGVSGDERRSRRPRPAYGSPVPTPDRAACGDRAGSLGATDRLLGCDNSEEGHLRSEQSPALDALRYDPSGCTGGGLRTAPTHVRRQEVTCGDRRLSRRLRLAPTRGTRPGASDRANDVNDARRIKAGQTVGSRRHRPTEARRPGRPSPYWAAPCVGGLEKSVPATAAKTSSDCDRK
jgi:hypothetical protein